MNLKAKIAIGGLAVVVAVGGLITVTSIEKIKPGYVGVVYSPSKGVSEETLSAGWHIVPFKKVTEYTVATEQAYLSADQKEGSEGDDSFSVVTKDGKNITVDVEFSYRFDSERIPQIFERFRAQSGKQIEQSFIRGKLKAWASEATSQFAVIDIYSDKRAEVNAMAFQHIKNKFSEYGIIIESFNFSRIGLDSQTEKAIQDRVNAQQELEKKKIEVENAKLEAERKAVEAQGEADKEVIRAKGKAEANAKLEETLTSDMLMSMWIQKWDGKLPTVSGSDAIVNMPKAQ